MTNPPLAEHSKPVRLASMALFWAHSRDTDRAARYIQRIHNECGFNGVITAMVGWMDTYADHATDGHLDPTGVTITSMKLMNAKTGQLEDLDDSPASDHVKWAARLVEARIRMNEDEFNQIMGELPAECGAYVLAVLLAVADTMNSMPRGFALHRGAQDN